MVRLSVITFTEPQLDNQTFRDFEVIWVSFDDRATVRVKASEAQRLAVGLAMATSDYLCFVDGTYSPDYLAGIFAALRKDELVGIGNEDVVPLHLTGWRSWMNNLVLGGPVEASYLLWRAQARKHRFQEAA